MGCTSSSMQEASHNSNLAPEALKQLSLTPLGYTLSPEEVKALCVDGKILSCGPNDVIYDRATAYHPQDKSLVVCMYYFGILCYGVAEVQSFDRSHVRTNYMAGPGSVLLGEHLFDFGKRHSLNRGYNIVAKTQCTILLVHLQTFERYAKTISPQRIDWWNSICTDHAGHILTAIFPGVQSTTRNELMTRVNWRVVEAGEELAPTPPFNPHKASLNLPKHTPTGQHGYTVSKRLSRVGLDSAGDDGDDDLVDGKPNPAIPFQYQKQNDPLGPRSMFIVVKGRLRKYPSHLPPDPISSHHKEVLLQSTQNPQEAAQTRPSPDPFDLEADFEKVTRFDGEDPQSLHRRLRPRLEIYCKRNALTSLNNGYVNQGEVLFDLNMLENAQFLVDAFVIAQERSLILEIPYHVFMSFKTQSYFHPVYQALKQMMTTTIATLVMNTHIDFFNTETRTTPVATIPGTQIGGPASSIPNFNSPSTLVDASGSSMAMAEGTSPALPPRNRLQDDAFGGGQFRTLNLRGQNALQLANQYQQQQLDFYSGLADKAEILIVKPGTVIQEPNRTPIDRLVVLLYGSVLIQDPEALQAGLPVPSSDPSNPTPNKGFNIIARAGDYLNELGLVTSYSRPYGIKTLTNCVYLTLTRTSFERLISNRDVSFFCIRLGRSQAPLEAILSHPQTSESFYKLAQSEHSTENLDFYKRILEFRSKFEGVTRTEVKVIRDATGRSVAALSYPYLYTELLEIYNHYIRPDHASAQVNLPHHVVDQVRESLFDDESHGIGPDGLIENLSHRSLDQALAEVILLMRRDIFTRYVVHESYLELLKQFKPYANAWKDDKETNKTRWCAKMRMIRPGAPAEFPDKLTTPAEQKDLVKFEKTLEETGLGIGNFYNLLQYNSLE